MAWRGGEDTVSRGVPEVSVCGLGTLFRGDCSGIMLMEDAYDLEVPFQP